MLNAAVFLAFFLYANYLFAGNDDAALAWLESDIQIIKRIEIAKTLVSTGILAMLKIEYVRLV